MYALAEELFVAESEVRFYGVRLETRMAVLRLSGARLLVYSPVFLHRSLRAELEGLGRVAWVLAPNKIHNQTLAAWREAYPEAALVAAPGLPERRSDLRFDLVLGRDPVPEQWGPAVDVALTGGNVFFSEALLLHRRSRTLLVADFVENFDRHQLSRTAWLLGRLFGVKERPAPSPEFRLYTLDAAAAERALEPVRDWEFDRIFLCHGRLVPERGRKVLGDVCDELLAIARGRGPLSRRMLSAVAARQ